MKSLVQECVASQHILLGLNNVVTLIQVTEARSLMSQVGLRTRLNTILAEPSASKLQGTYPRRNSSLRCTFATVRQEILHASVTQLAGGISWRVKL
jgi:hypothetical protein